MRDEFSQILDSVWEETLPGDKKLCLADMKEMLESVGIHLPNYRVRDITTELSEKEVRDMSKAEFARLCQELTRQDVSRTFKTSKQHDRDAVKIQGEMGATHLVLNEEQAAFADWINTHLSQDPDVAHKLKLSEGGAELYEKMDDGVILCKMINLAAPDTIDERVINTGLNIPIFKQHENLTLAINSAKAIGCVVIGIDSHTLNSSQGKKWLVLGLVWQLIKMFLFKSISISQVPGLVNLLREGEEIGELMKLSPEQLLLRWVNHQLEKAGCSRLIKNFSEDIKDSEIYTELIAQVAPRGQHIDKHALTRQDWLERADIMLSQAEKIDCKAFVTAQDVVNGHEKLNLAFVANLFNNHPGLDPPEEELTVIEETREEKMFRNWMNSLGVRPHVNYLYSDLSNGLVIFQLMDYIRPGIVDWEKRVIRQEKMSGMMSKRFQEILSNCNYAVELARKLNLVIVGIAGSDIQEGNPTLTLAVVWQLMRSYTLALLSRLNSSSGLPVGESEIVQWTNERLEASQSDLSISHFQDKKIRSSLPILHLIEVLQPGTVDWSDVITPASQSSSLSYQQCMDNAKYAVTMARKIGAPVYALPEDIAEGKHKMVMTVFASLMLTDLN